MQELSIRIGRRGKIRDRLNSEPDGGQTYLHLLWDSMKDCEDRARGLAQSESAHSETTGVEESPEVFVTPKTE
jgi:hypothetical protein